VVPGEVPGLVEGALAGEVTGVNGEVAHAPDTTV
jgi:hypothetical protein